MKAKKMLGLILLSSVVFACSEGTGPDASIDDSLLFSATPNLVKWSTGGAPSFSSEGDILTSGSDSPLFSVVGEGGGTYTNEYKVVFWAVSGEHRYVQINYTNADGSVSPFLRLDVYEPDELPDGSELSEGDSVRVGISVDPYTMQVQLYPHGLTFDEETELTMWYGGANGDLNGDGVVDDYDQKIEYNMLGIWYQPTPNDPWTILDADQDFEDNYLEVELEHFSGYGVAW